jgi:hypothetical protein
MAATPTIESDPLDGLTEKQTAFVLAYCEHGQATRAARDAGYGAPQVAAWRCMNHPRVRGAIAAIRAAVFDEQIASVREVSAALTAIVRDDKAKATDQIAASNTLLKVQGALGPDAYVDNRTQTVAVHIGADTPLDLLDTLDLLRRLAAGEAVEPSEAAECLAELMPPKKVLDS